MRILLAVSFIVFAAPVMAMDYCDEAWFLRNIRFDRAGYCFGSTLGQSVFDNSDCTGKTVQLQPVEATAVQKIQEFEEWIGCKVDTSKTTLDVPHLELLRNLRDLPIPQDGGFGCYGWLGESATLYAGFDESTPVVGQIQPGDDLVLDYQTISPEGWYLMFTSKDQVRQALGWTTLRIETHLCTQAAG